MRGTRSNGTNYRRIVFKWYPSLSVYGFQQYNLSFGRRKKSLECCQSASSSINQIAKNLGTFDSETIIGDILINNKLLSFVEIGKRIREQLKKKRITQQSVADAYHMDLRALTRKLEGKYLTFNDIVWFCKTYDFNPVDLILDNNLG